MPAAVVGGIIAAGGALGSAAIVSHSAGKAADQQAAAGEKALALQRDIYNQQQANEAPFRNTGAAAITTLGGLLGLPSGGGSGQLMQQEAMHPLSDAPISPGQANFAGYSPSGGYIGKNVPMGERMSNSNVNVDAAGYTAQQHGASMPSSSSYGNQTFGSQTGGGMVQVKAPNGQVYSVPVEKVAEAKQNGGTVLGRA